MTASPGEDRQAGYAFAGGDAMSTELPMACSLSAAELPARLDEMAAVGRAGLIASELASTRAVLRFRDDGAGTRDRLAAIVAAESECCAFLAMRIADEGDAITLTIDGPEGSEPVIEGIVEAFSAER